MYSYNLPLQCNWSMKVALCGCFTCFRTWPVYPTIIPLTWIPNYSGLNHWKNERFLHFWSTCCLRIEVCHVLVCKRISSSGLIRWLRDDLQQQQQQQQANLMLFFLNSGQKKAYTAVLTQELDAGAINMNHTIKKYFVTPGTPSKTSYLANMLPKILGPQQRTKPNTATTNKRIDFDLCFATALWIAPFLLLFHKWTAILVYATAI